MYKLEKGNNQVHGTAIIDKSVKLGENNVIGPYCMILPNVTIGNNNKFLSHTVIGGPPEHRTVLKEGKWYSVVIGNDNIFNEYVTVSAGAFQNTTIGNDCFILRGSYIGHDSILGNGITVSCNSLIGGHTIIDDFANLGLGSICHQFSYIGKGSMIGMGGIVTKNKEILPFAIYVGNPVSYLKKNIYLINKHDVTDETLLKETAIYFENLHKFHNK